jgi:hypothetical protein
MGTYQDNAGVWHLADGTMLMDVDQTTGAYQETDGTWYTYQGVALMSYDPKTGSYQENDGTWYDRNGNAIQNPPASSSSKTTLGSILSQVADSLLGKKTAVSPYSYVPPVVTPTPVKSNTGVIVGLVLGVAVVAGILVYVNKQKK